MSHEFIFSDDELRIVCQAIERELENSRLELRHTRNLDYREDVKQHIQTLEHMLNGTFADAHAMA
jgi:hypothetical protein